MNPNENLRSDKKRDSVTRFSTVFSMKQFPLSIPLVPFRIFFRKVLIIQFGHLFGKIQNDLIFRDFGEDDS
jgi:hypothetical protein